MPRSRRKAQASGSAGPGFRASELLSLRLGDVLQAGRIAARVTVRRRHVKGRTALRRPPPPGRQGCPRGLGLGASTAAAVSPPTRGSFGPARAPTGPSAAATPGGSAACVRRGRPSTTLRLQKGARVRSALLRVHAAALNFGSSSVRRHLGRCGSLPESIGQSGRAWHPARRSPGRPCALRLDLD